MIKIGALDYMKAAVVGLAIIGIVASIMLTVQMQTHTQIVAINSGNATSEAAMASQTGIDATADLVDWLPVIVVVLAAVLILGFVYMLERRSSVV